MTYIQFTPPGSARFQLRAFMSAELPDHFATAAVIDHAKECVAEIAKHYVTTEKVPGWRIVTYNVVAMQAKDYEEALRNAYLQGLRDGRKER